MGDGEKKVKGEGWTGKYPNCTESENEVKRLLVTVEPLKKESMEGLGTHHLKEKERKKVTDQRT